MYLKVTPYINNMFGESYEIYDTNPKSVSQKLISDAKNRNLNNIHLIGNKPYFSEIKKSIYTNNQEYSNLIVEVY